RWCRFLRRESRRCRGCFCPGKSRGELRLRAASILAIRVLPSRRVDRSAPQDAFSFSLLTKERSAGQEHSYAILRIAKNPRNWPICVRVKFVRRLPRAPPGPLPAGVNRDQGSCRKTDV